MCRAVSSAYVVGVAPSAEEKAGPSGYFSFCWKHRPLFLSHLLAQPKGVSLLAADAAHKEEFPERGTMTFPRKPLPVIRWTNVKQTPFSGNLVLHSMFCFLLCSCSFSLPTEVSPGRYRGIPQQISAVARRAKLPQPCRWGSERCQLGSQLPWLLGRFNQAGMKASFTEFIAKLNRPGFDKRTPLIHVTGDKLGSRFLLEPTCCPGVQHGKKENLGTPLWLLKLSRKGL